MAPPSPARLYATLAGAFLFVFGLAGFFDDLFWLNFLYVGSGALGLLLAGAAPRPFALVCGIAYTGLAVFAFDQTGWLHLAVGLLRPRRGGGDAQSRERRPPERALSPLSPLCRLRRRSSSRTRAPVATLPAPTATTGRTQLRGSRRARSSPSESSSAQSESSSAAAWVIAESVSSTRAGEALRGLDRAQRVGQQLLDVPGAAAQALTRLAHRSSPPAAA